jgi:hypothetical protein
MGSMVTRNGSTTVQQAAQEELIPSLQLIEQVEEFPEESFGKVYTELAVMR